MGTVQAPAGPHRDELEDVLRLVSKEAERYLADLDHAAAAEPTSEPATASV